jgi:ABC-2 type transport system permease protein
MSTPISVWAILIGDVIASFLYGLSVSIVPIAVGLVIGVNIGQWAVLGLSMLLASFCFACFSILLSAYPPTDIPSTVMMVSNLVKFPLVFISGVFIPIWEMQDWMRIIASFSPLTYFTDLVNYSVQGVSYYPVFVNCLALIGFTMFFLVVAIKVHERTMPRRL